MDINNLTNVYNNNPTLQGSYTLQQYLDLFGGSSTPPTPDPDPDPTPDPDPDPTPGSGQGIIGADMDRGSKPSIVDTTSISEYRNPSDKAYMPGGQLEINPASYGMSFNNTTGQPEFNFGSFSERSDPGLYRGLMSQNVVGNMNRKDLQNQYNMSGKMDEYFGRRSNFVDAKYKGKFGELINKIPSITGIISKFAGDPKNASNNRRYGVSTDKGGYSDEFGVATFDRKDGFLGLKGDVTDTYDSRMQGKIDTIQDFFTNRSKNKSQFKDLDFDNLTDADIEKMKNVNGFMTKQFLAYKNRLKTNKINQDYSNKIEKERIDRIEQAKMEQKIQAEANARGLREQASIQAMNKAGNAAQSDRTGGNVNLGGAAGNMGGGSRQATSAGSTSSGRKDGGWGWADGGVVSLKNGGSTNGSGEAALSAKVKELMDDGYEFGEAVKEAMKQGYANGGRIKGYFKGGLVSLRGR